MFLQSQNVISPNPLATENFKSHTLQDIQQNAVIDFPRTNNNSFSTRDIKLDKYFVIATQSRRPHFPLIPFPPCPVCFMRRPSTGRRFSFMSIWKLYAARLSLSRGVTVERIERKNAFPRRFESFPS